MEQLVTYDYKTQIFNNETRPFHAYGGEAQFVPQYGEEGVILFFGGIQRADRTISTDGVGVANLSTIQVYDVHTDTFYNQTATNAPMERYEFCSVGVSNVQNNSHEMYVLSPSISLISFLSSDFVPSVYETTASVLINK